MEGFLRIVLVDDHAVFRQALGAILTAKDPSVTIVGEAGTAHEGTALIAKTEPDVVVMDLLLDGASGIGAIYEVRRLRLACRILVLTAVSEPGFVADALSAGADGVALKQQTIEEIIAAIWCVAGGSSYVAPRVERVALGLARRPLTPSPNGAVSRLSVRESEVFRLVVAGLTNQRIASELFISVKTVETHRMHINKKLRVHSTVELVRLAALQGLVSA